MVSTLLSTWFARPASAARVAPPPVGSGDAGPPRSACYGAPPRRRPESPAGLEVAVSQTADGLFIRVKGVAGVEQSGSLLSGLLAATARRQSLVTLDLSSLSFISCLAMGVLAAYRRGVVRGGGRVMLAGRLQPAVREALSQAELMSLFGVVSVRSPDSAA